MCACVFVHVHACDVVKICSGGCGCVCVHVCDVVKICIGGCGCECVCMFFAVVGVVKLVHTLSPN